MNHSISTAKMPIGPFAAPASPPPAPRPTFIVEALPLSVPPLPQPEYSHCRTNKAHEQAMNSPLPSEFDQKRREFIKLFTSDYWNRPGENLDYLRKELQQSKALVVTYMHAIFVTVLLTYGFLDCCSLRRSRPSACDIRGCLQHREDTRYVEFYA